MLWILGYWFVKLRRENGISHLKLRFGDEDGGGFNGGDVGRQRRGEDKPGAWCREKKKDYDLRA